MQEINHKIINYFKYGTFPHILHPLNIFMNSFNLLFVLTYTKQTGETVCRVLIFVCYQVYFLC